MILFLLSLICFWVLGVGVGWKSGVLVLINNYKMTEREVSDR